LQSLPNVIRVIKVMSVRWAGHVARMERRQIRAGYFCPGEFARKEAA